MEARIRGPYLSVCLCARKLGEIIRKWIKISEAAAATMGVVCEIFSTSAERANNATCVLFVYFIKIYECKTENLAVI